MKIMIQLKAVIFDLDGVITDTAEFHYQAWQRLADEEGFTFNREMNEQLRGVPRRESLLHILNGRSVSEEQLQAMMARKNNYYVAMLDEITQIIYYRGYSIYSMNLMPTQFLTPLLPPAKMHLMFVNSWAFAIV